MVGNVSLWFDTTTATKVWRASNSRDFNKGCDVWYGPNRSRDGNPPSPQHDDKRCNRWNVLPAGEMLVLEPAEVDIDIHHAPVLEISGSLVWSMVIRIH